MQYDASTPQEYVAQLEDDWRKPCLLKIRDLLINTCPTLDEAINYKMLAYSDNRGPLFHLNAQKNYVSLYIGDAKKVDPSGELLKGLDVGKGCLRFKKSTNIDDTDLPTFIARTYELWNKGVDVGC